MKVNRRIHLLHLLGLSGLLSGTSALALERPLGKVILTVQGAITERNDEQGARFDLAMLQSLPQHRFTTLTPWNPALLRDVLKAVGAQGRELEALALNDYRTRIPLDDVLQHDVIVAHHMNGALIPVRTKGPLFIVYPFDSKPELRANMYYERSAWQLKTLTVH
jgi:hypothetical protein